MFAFSRPEIPCLSLYNRHILNQVIAGFSPDVFFNLHTLVEQAVAYKCILPHQTQLVMETFYAIAEYLVTSGLLVEGDDDFSYRLTDKGILLKRSATIEAYEKYERKSIGGSFFHRFFSGSHHKAKEAEEPRYYE